MALTSFARPSADGWRYSLSRRTRREGGEWVIQKWNGKSWVEIGRAPSYNAARRVASDD